ncbi:MAG: hypothetical protein ISR84_00560 [Kiritimatiellales bacterium]|nr:hypothetical protein [Kiritimatiellales bacterium]
MSKLNPETPELDIAGLLSLKTFERPDSERIEKSIQSTMQAVRASRCRPSLHFFPDKSTAWMFTQPRYGIAALFILFLGLHLMQRPMPTVSIGSAGVLEEPGAELDLASVVHTNTPPSVAIPAVGTDYSSLIRPVSFTE